jgi:hypothetical protein
LKKKPRTKGKLVQTVITPALAHWVKREATFEGITVAAWLRRLLMRACERQTRHADPEIGYTGQENK